MPKQFVEDKLWDQKIPAAIKYKEQWEKLFKTKACKQYYEGFQYKNQEVDSAEAPYVINKVYETIQIKVDGFIPSQLRFTVSARAANADYNLEFAGVSANLKQDVLNTLISDDRAKFVEEVREAYKDSFFGFGLVETGYSADWIINPRAPKPFLNTDAKINQQGKPKVSFEPPELPADERVYYKHIPFDRFVVGGFDHKYLERCAWFGYYEWMYIDDILALPALMNRDKLENIKTSVENKNVTTDSFEHKDSSMVKVWHIWNNRNKTRLIVTDSPKITIFQRKFDDIGIADLRHDLRVQVEGFYPIPPVFHWLSPQNEINETRQQLRAHRQRFNRKYQIVEEMIDEAEIEKFETGGDGTLVKVKRENAISPIADAPLGQAVAQAMVSSSDDLNQISGTSMELRGVADRTTATQANIINTKGSVRENAQRDFIAKWLCRIGRMALLTAQKKFALGIYAKFTTDPGEQLFQTMQESQDTFKWVSAQELNDGYDFTINVDVTTLSAESQEIEKKKFFDFLAATTQFPQVAMSPTLIRETAYRVGYRNERVIKEMQKMALVHQFGQMQQMQQSMGGGQQMNPGNAGQQITAQNTPNTMEQIRNQLSRQLLPQ